MLSLLLACAPVRLDPEVSRCVALDLQARTACPTVDVTPLMAEGGPIWVHFHDEASATCMPGLQATAPAGRPLGVCRIGGGRVEWTELW